MYTSYLFFVETVMGYKEKCTKKNVTPFLCSSSCFNFNHLAVYLQSSVFVIRGGVAWGEICGGVVVVVWDQLLVHHHDI